jgi:hypothetical protein
MLNRIARPIKRRSVLDGVHDDDSSEVENPIQRLGGTGVGCMSSQMALNATLNFWWCIRR